MKLTARQRQVLAVIAAVLVVAALWWAQGGSQGGVEPDSSTDSAATDSAATDSASGLPTVKVADLPPEAGETLELIDDGGPYPYDRDGVTFENREDLLPDHPLGYYREYTVPTPGSEDRGARRIVVGDGEEFYWTADHYSSFSRIQR